MGLQLYAPVGLLERIHFKIFEVSNYQLSIEYDWKSVWEKNQDVYI